MVGLWIRSSLPKAPGTHPIPLQRGGPLQPAALVSSDQEISQILQDGHHLLSLLPPLKAPPIVSLSSGEETDLDPSEGGEIIPYRHCKFLMVGSLLVN